MSTTHNYKHDIELNKCILSEFIFESIYNMPNRYPETQSFVDTLCFWEGEIEIFDKDLALPFRDLLLKDCISSWRQPSAATFVEDLLSICRVLYVRGKLNRLLSKLENGQEGRKKNGHC